MSLFQFLLKMKPILTEKYEFRWVYLGYFKEIYLVFAYFEFERKLFSEYIYNYEFVELQ